MFVDFFRAFSAPSNAPKKLKKGGKLSMFVLAFYACFLSINTPTMAIAIIRTITAMIMYVITDVVVARPEIETGVGVGDAVGAVATVA